MRPVLESALAGEVRVKNIVQELANKLGLTADEQGALLPSGKQTIFANRVHWAKTYLKQAGLVEITRRGHFTLTERGRVALADEKIINNDFLERFSEFQNFKNRVSANNVSAGKKAEVVGTESTPDETLRLAHSVITNALSGELLDRIKEAPPAFFEKLIVELLSAMGFFGGSEEAGRAIW